MVVVSAYWQGTYGNFFISRTRFLWPHVTMKFNLAVLFAFLASGVAVQGSEDLSGTWVMNADLSAQATGHPIAISSSTVTLRSDGTSISYAEVATTEAGQSVNVKFAARFDGHQYAVRMSNFDPSVRVTVTINRMSENHFAAVVRVSNVIASSTDVTLTGDTLREALQVIDPSTGEVNVATQIYERSR